MSEQKPMDATPDLKLGDQVAIRLAEGLQGRIVELRGPLGPGGAHIYRLEIRRKPKPYYVEVRGDQIELVPVVQKSR